MALKTKETGAFRLVCTKTNKRYTLQRGPKVQILLEFNALVFYYINYQHFYVLNWKAELTAALELHELHKCV